MSLIAKTDAPDTFTYDPLHPTPSYGGNVCCAANTIPGNGGALDQRKMEERQDILVCSTSPRTGRRYRAFPGQSR